MWSELWTAFTDDALYVVRAGDDLATLRWAIATAAGFRWGRVVSELLEDILELGTFDPVDEADWA